MGVILDEERFAVRTRVGFSSNGTAGGNGYGTPHENDLQSFTLLGNGLGAGCSTCGTSFFLKNYDYPHTSGYGGEGNSDGNGASYPLPLSVAHTSVDDFTVFSVSQDML